MKGMGGEGMRTSAAHGVGGGGAWLRRTFAVGRLRGRTVEVRVALGRGRAWPSRLLARAYPGGRQAGGRVVH